MNGFTGFPGDGLALLASLPSHDTPWFKSHKREYEAGVASPAKAFVEALGERLRAEISPSIEAIPRTNGSIAPINNDVRFAKDAPIYKDHLLFRFWEGTPKKQAPTLFVRLSATDLGFASGAAFATPDRWRAAVGADSTGAALASLLDGLRARHPIDIAGAATKRVPAPYEPDHERADLLRLRGFQVRWSEPAPAVITGPDLVDWCLERLNELAPVHAWLVANIGDA